LTIGGLSQWAFSSVLVSLRFTPVLAFAPPFSLAPMPLSARVLFGLGLSGVLVASRAPVGMDYADMAAVGLALAHELLVGLIFVLTFQLMFAALYLVGRVVDIQAGFGLALLVDPTTRSNTPLVGTLFAFAAGAVFFGLNGQYDLMRIFSSSLDIAPVGAAALPGDFSRILEFVAVSSSLAFGVAGGVILSLFLTDLAIAALSRTVPQMNVLVLGFQAKTIILMLALPATLGVASVAMAKMVRVTLETMPRLI
jgi:flagellar biosynthetic protein FliR